MITIHYYYQSENQLLIYLSDNIFNFSRMRCFAIIQTTIINQLRISELKCEM
jgi:hypothetical protein